LLIVTALVSLIWWVQDVFDPEHDACMYIEVTRSLLAGQGITLLGEPFGVRPLVFPLLLAPLMAAVGTHVFALNLFVSLLGVACVGLLFVHTRSRLGIPVALALSALAWRNPGFRSLCNQIMSDVPGMALALGCLLLERFWRNQGPSRSLLLGVLIGLAALVRTMNLMLLPAILLAARARSGGQRVTRLAALRMILGTVLVGSPWVVRNVQADFKVPSEQTFIHSYGAGMFHRDARDPSSDRVPLIEVAARVPVQLSKTFLTLGSRLGSGCPSAPAAWFGALVILSTVLVAARRREPAEFLCLAMLGVISIYFAYDGRLVLPLFLLGLPALAEASIATLSRVGLGKRRSTWAVALGLVGLGLADVQWIPDVELLEAHALGIESVVEHIEAQVPVGASIGVRIGGELGVYMADRSVYSLHSVTRQGSWSLLEAFLLERGIDYCVFHEPKRAGLPASASGLRHRNRAVRMHLMLKASFEELDHFDGWSIHGRVGR
jgi:4-amino-4-deoxy-L-arabinose transferase-like glycosyltransferase